MHLEIELKFRLGDAIVLERQLADLGARQVATLRQVDQYFNHPARDFSVTDEALRIRSIGTENRVTYKGPKLDESTKTRNEIEIGLESGAQAASGFAEILSRLGFVASGVVHKSRRVFELVWEGQDVEIAFDSVPPLGDFIELETQASPSVLPEARESMLRLANRLQLRDGIRTSYLEMVLAQSNKG